MQTQILGLVTPLIALLFAATFALAWRMGRMRRHVLGFAIAYLLFGCGFLVTHLLPPEALFTFHITQALYSAGAVVLLGSVCERAGQKLNLPSMAVVYILFASAVALCAGLSNDVGPRLVLANVGYGVMFAMGVTVLLIAGRRTAVDIAIIAILAFQAADFMIRPTVTLLFERTIDAAVYRDSVYYSLIGLVLGVKAVTMAMILVLATLVEWASTLRERGERDTLTGLRNRGAFEQAIRAMLPRAQVEERPLSLVVADIDHFKQVNDIWGHQAGDAAITGFADLIGDTVRDCDIPGRIGGEEFCIAVWNCQNEAAERLAERIRLAFARLEQRGLGQDIRLTASFGIATARGGESYAQLFKRADAALYRAKNNGRNRVENADGPMRDDADETLSRELFEMRRSAVA